MISIERAATAMIATMASATSTIVTPRSRRRKGRRNLRIAGGFMRFSILVHRYSGTRDCSGQCRAGTKDARDAAESPRVGMLNADTSADHHGQGARQLGRRAIRAGRLRCYGVSEIIAPVNGDDHIPGLTTVSTGGRRGRPRQASCWRVTQLDAAVVNVVGPHIVVNAIKRVAYTVRTDA